MEPLDDVDGVGLGVGVGEGGLGGGLTVLVGDGRGAGALDDGDGAGADALCDPGPGLAACVLLRCDELGLALGDPDAEPLGVADGVPGGDDGGADAVVVDAAEELNRFIMPTTPTLLSRVARQVSLESRRRPASRRTPTRSLYLMPPANWLER